MYILHRIFVLLCLYISATKTIANTHCTVDYNCDIYSLFTINIKKSRQLKILIIHFG